MTVKNLTPEHLRCIDDGKCPSIHRLDDGRLLIVGLDVVKHPDLLGLTIPPPAGLDVGNGERAIVISPDLLADYVADQSAWRPISTAPKDGTRILGRYYRSADDEHPEFSELREIWWEPYTLFGMDMPWRAGDPLDSHEGASAGDHYGEAMFTHWQPLPLPPQTQGSDEEAQSADEVSAADQPASLTQKDSTHG